MKLNRLPAQYLSTVVSICLGFGLVALSMIDIKNENDEMVLQKIQDLENEAEGEEGGAPPEAEHDGDE